jgi:MFS family permease
MLPLAALGIGLSPVAARMVHRRGVRAPLLIGCAGLIAGLLAVLTIDEHTSVIGIVVVGTVLGLPSAFNNLALQAGVYASAPAGQTGVATGLFQTCRYLGAIMSTALLAIAFEHEVGTAGLHRISWLMVVVAVALTVSAAGAGHIRTHRRGGLHRWPREPAGEPRHLANGQVQQFSSGPPRAVVDVADGDGRT